MTLLRKVSEFSELRYAKDGLSWPDDFVGKIVVSDCMDALRQMPDQSIQTCITSPPYWGLRNYGVDGQLGLEETPEEYVEKMVTVFHEVRRVLKDDGTLWLNLGDSYNSPPSGKNPGGFQGEIMKRNQDYNLAHPRKVNKGKVTNGYKPKDLVGIPWMVAFALRKDGWYLRCDIIWSKPNPMPESVTDRPTKSHEYIFLMAKNQKYYYDHEAIKEKAVADRWGGNKPMNTNNSKDNDNQFKGLTRARDMMPEYRNKRSVWTIATQPHSFAHFATFPTKLIDPCILAGSAKGDIVVDPFFGSGSVGLRAKQLERRYIGIELNPDYVKIAEDRLRQEELF